MADKKVGPATSSAGLNVLIVEDNPVNQRVAMGLITRLGHTASIAENGLDAIEAVKNGDFDLIFMDIHMPIMEGHEATRHIRALPNDKSNTPIVAMTAKALAGDREECLAAGMDDYLSKPVHREALAKCIETWSKGRGIQTEDLSQQSTNGDATPPLFDNDIVSELKIVAGESGFSDLVTTLLSTALDQLAAIEDAIAQGDGATVSKKAYSLRGASANMGLSALSDVAKKIETLANTDLLDEVANLVKTARSLVKDYQQAGT